jgi:bifunctional enzyme CysN/CysC
MSKLFLESGTVVITSFISPLSLDRLEAMIIIGKANFIEVFVDCPLDECEKRDVKGLYLKARNGELKNFTGIDSPYEPPENPDIRVNTVEMTHAEAAEHIVRQLMPLK